MYAPQKYKVSVTSLVDKGIFSSSPQFHFENIKIIKYTVGTNTYNIVLEKPIRSILKPLNIVSAEY